MEIINVTDKAPLTEEDAKQMAEAIEAFNKGEEQPQGRFVVLGQLKKGN